MNITSPAFQEGSSIPTEYTCDARNISPPLAWTDLPAGTAALTLIADDPDAPGGTWVHWLLYDLPPGTTGLAPDQPKTQYLPGGAMQGINGFRALGYGGPCPPPGKPHRYFFRLYALSKRLELKPGISRVELDRAMLGHILAEAQLMGTYSRQRR